ncbi:MAG: methyl-accepting chemotaxis protein [Phycisphaeraceae bacterium]
MRVSLGKKLGLGFGVLIAMIAILTTVVVMQVNRLNAQTEHVFNYEVKSVEHAIATQGEIHHALSMHRGYMILGLDALNHERLETWVKINEHVDTLDKLSVYWEKKETIDNLAQLKKVIVDFRTAQDQIAAVAHSDENIPAQTKYFNDAMPHGEAMVESLDKILIMERKLEATNDRKLLVEYVSAAKGHLLRASQAITAFLVSGDEQQLSNVHDEVTSCQASVDRLSNKVDLLTPEQKVAFDRYISERELFLAQAKQVIALRSTEDWCQSENICLTVVTPLAAEADKLLGAIVEDQAAAEHKAEADLIAGGHQLSLITLITAILASIIGIAVAFVLSRRISKSLNQVVSRAQSIASKDLSVEKLDIKSKDEIGDLANAVNDMLDSLREIISEVAQSSKAVASASTEIAGSAEELSRGMEEQQSQAMQVSSAIEEMSASVVEVARKSADAARDADEAGRNATQGGLVVSQTVDGMNEIAMVVNESARAVQELGQRSEQIGQVILVINDIADQTNLLALNAAIEAARAGEHGRGFAVVADEVRKLADRTTKATEEIAQSITAIQSETGQAVSRIEQGTSKVEDGVQLAQQAGTSLASIVDGSNNVSQMIRSIAAAAEEQSAASEQVSRSVEQIAQVTRQSSDASSQSALAANDLSQRAEELLKIVDQFRIK